MIAGYDLLRFAHILLFAYWLGADLGVFLGARRASKPGTPYSERIAIREVVTAVDMAPRSALILMLPVGFSLAASWGLPLSQPLLLTVWVVGLAWFGLMWGVHLWSGTPKGETARKIDLAVRYAALIGMAALGCASLAGFLERVPAWLGVKLLLFGAIIACGLGLRVFAAINIPLMSRLAAGNDPEAEQLLEHNGARARRLALTLWSLVLIMALLGATKPQFG